MNVHFAKVWLQNQKVRRAKKGQKVALGKPSRKKGSNGEMKSEPGAAYDIIDIRQQLQKPLTREKREAMETGMRDIGNGDLPYGKSIQQGNSRKEIPGRQGDFREIAIKQMCYPI